MTKIHPTAIVDPKAEISDSATIGPYSIIEKDVVIGDNTSIGAYTHVHGGTTIGKDNIIFDRVGIGSLHPSNGANGGHVRIGNGNRIHERVIIISGSEKTTIGDKNLLYIDTLVGNDSTIGDNNQIVGGKIAGHVVIDNWVFVGGYAGVQQFVHLGDCSFVEGMSLITKDVPPYAAVARNRTTDGLGIEYLNLIAAQRAGITPKARENIKTAYQRLFDGGIRENAGSLAEILGTEEANVIAEFVLKSDNGIYTPRRNRLHWHNPALAHNKPAVFQSVKELGK